MRLDRGTKEFSAGAHAVLSEEVLEQRCESSRWTFVLTFYVLISKK